MAEQHDITAEDLKPHIKAAADPRHEDRLTFIHQLYGGATVPEAAEDVGY